MRMFMSININGVRTLFALSNPVQHIQLQLTESLICVATCGTTGAP